MASALTHRSLPHRHERIVVAYSAAGHALMHFLAAFWPYVVISLREAWATPGQPIDDQILLLPLWQLGSFLLGLAALPAGWLSDRWSAPGMMVVMFLGLGASALFCGTVGAGDVDAMKWGLAGLGLFGAIYHAVGIGWVMRNAERPGHAMGVNGVFGSLGLMAAGLVTGLLCNLFSWRAAFYVPGALCLAIGLMLLVHWRAGVVGDRPMPPSAGAPPSRGDLVRVFFILTFTMFVGGVVWNAVQYGAPGLIGDRMREGIDWLRGAGVSGFGIETQTVFWVGLFGSAIYGVSGLFQYFTGSLADRHSLKTLYTVCALLQAAIMAGIALSPGVGVLLFAMASSVVSAMSTPAENLLIGRYTPTRYHGLGFGAKFIVAFGAGPIAIELIRRVKGETGELELLFLSLSVAAALVWAVALLLPGGDRTEAAPAPRPAPAE